MAKVLFVVHRYAPYSGGSEYYTQNMAEELLMNGHKVTVLAHEHKGNLNGVTVTNDYNSALNEKWDLIIVHGCDCISQNIVLSNAAIIPSPICYMIIKPSDSKFARHGMKYAKYLSYSTSMDLAHIKEHGYLSKSRRIRHGISTADSLGAVMKNIVPYYVSAGGFYPHKGMDELAKHFDRLGPEGTELHLFGYANGNMPNSDRVKSLLGMEKSSVMDAIASSKGYILNSYEEGFGLVLLEAMLNKVPCYARNIAGAKDMKPYVITYENETELFHRIREFEILTDDEKQGILKYNYDYVISNHTMKQTANDIIDILNEELSHWK